MKYVSAKKILSMVLMASLSCGVLGCNQLGSSSGAASSSPSSSGSSSTSSSASGNASSGSVLSQSVNTVGQKVQSAAFLTNAEGLALGKPVKPTLFQKFFGIETATADPFNGLWDEAGTVLGLNWQQISIKQYLGEAMNSGFTNPNGANDTAFGRYNTAVSIMCALGVGLSEQGVTGIPDDGTYNFTVSVGPGTAISEKCNGFSDSQPQSFSATLVVSTPADTSLYMKELNMTSPDGPSSGPMFITYSPTWIRIASTDVNTNLQGVGRTIADYDIVNDVVRFEFLAQSFGDTTSAEFHRIYMDGVNNQGYIMSHFGAINDGDLQYIHFVASGTPNDANRTNVAVSVGVKGQQTTDAEGLNACVSTTDGSILTDGSLNCQTVGQDISTATAILPSINKHAQMSDITLDASMGVPFQNGTDILTTETY